MGPTINGAQSVVQTLVNCGVDICFGNPGTSEMHFVAALDSVSAMRPVLCLFEGVATGAADGYGRIAGKPAATLLHLGPGLANGLANLHNARRAASPIVNIVGDHASYHAQYDAPLASDIAGFAWPVSSWVHESRSAGAVASDTARAVQAARSAPGGIATLIMPADAAWNEAERRGVEARRYRPGAGRRRYHRAGGGAAVERQEIGAADARQRAARQRPGSRRPGAGQDRRAADVRYVRAAFGARRRPRAGGADSLFRRADRRLPEGRRATDPGRRQAAGVVLRLSRQAELGLAGRLRLHLSGAAARGRRAGAAGSRRCAGCAGAARDPDSAGAARPAQGAVELGERGADHRALHARPRDLCRGSQHLRPAADDATGARAADDASAADRRLDRAGPAAGDRRGDRGARPQGGVPASATAAPPIRCRRCGPWRGKISTSPW